MRALCWPFEPNNLELINFLDTIAQGEDENL